MVPETKQKQCLKMARKANPEASESNGASGTVYVEGERRGNVVEVVVVAKLGDCRKSGMPDPKLKLEKWRAQVKVTET